VAAGWVLAGTALDPAAPGGSPAARPLADPTTLLLLLGVAVTGTVGQVFLTKAYAAGAPARVAVLSLTQVVFGLGFDAVLLGQSPPPASLAGTLLVLAPTAWLLTRAGGVADDAADAGGAV
jgi:drug/metabolite transporter (DMT)-like permease